MNYHIIISKIQIIKYKGGISINLYTKNKDDYGLDYEVHILEQWKTCIDMADRGSDPRVTVNNLFITLNSVILALSAIIPKKSDVSIAIVGIIISFLWITTITSYKNLNSAKFKVINELEKQLPTQPFNYEWFLVGEGQDKKKYKKLTQIEKNVPIIFIIIYLAILVLNIIF